MELTEDFLVKIGGWEAMKEARAALASGRVLSSDWSPPLLKGIIQEGSNSYRAGLVIKSTVDIDNLCSCRSSRAWGTICAHSIAIGLHHIRSKNPLPAPSPAVKAAESKPAPSAAAKKNPPQIQRVPEGGVEARLHVIFPPNLPDALQRGKVTLCFEAESGGRRWPLAALPNQIIYTFPQQDSEVLDAVERIAEGEIPGMLMLTADALASLLPALTNHERLTIGKSREIRVHEEPAPLKVKARVDDKGEIALETSMTAQGAVFGSTRRWVLKDGEFQPFALPAGVDLGSRKITRDQAPHFFGTIWPLLQRSGKIEANFKPEDFEFEPGQPQFHLSLKGGIAHLQARLAAEYAGQSHDLGTPDGNKGFWIPDPKHPLRYTTRNPTAENEARQQLLRAGFTGPSQDGTFQLAGQNLVLTFFARDFPQLQKTWKIDLEERLERSTRQNLERIEPRFAIQPSGQNWFDLDVSFSTSGGEHFSPAEIQRLILSGQNHTRLKNGKFALIDTGAVEELQQVILDCAPEQLQGKYRMQNAQAGFLDAALRAQADWKVQASPQWRERAARQRGEAELPVPPLGGLDTVLRPYQKAGVGWLQFLRENNFGGILADEMGLGKTLQTLAFLQSVLKQEAPGQPCLIVCPTTLVFNWVAEAAKFTPELKVLAFHGAQRARLADEIPKADLVITSYALIRRDAEVYRTIEFDTIVLDEAQHIKNRQTQNAQAVKSVRGRRRLVLTGTPLENSVLDLWSIFDFLMPGYLGTAADFKERYEVPITRDKSAEVQARLARRVRPFLLRRLKQEVARDLPERIEQVAFCELTEEQQAAYQQVLEATRQEVVNAVDAQGMQKSRMIVLNALLRLRQICCDLRLLKPASPPEKPSGKMDLFGELLEEALDGGHRLLVFSQFVSMLRLLEERLKAEEIHYTYLDGSTTDRAAVVERFQKDASIPVFLISLKAGGVGLNLTAADTVIHFDPWWNPAVEAQATDRAHRIGQTKVVTSYKLITRNTVEEKILQLQARKKELIKATLEGEEQFAESLTWEEIQGLLA